MKTNSLTKQYIKRGPNKQQHNKKHAKIWQTASRGLVSLYDIRPGNGSGPFWQPRSLHRAWITGVLQCCWMLDYIWFTYDCQVTCVCFLFFFQSCSHLTLTDVRKTFPYVGGSGLSVRHSTSKSFCYFILPLQTLIPRHKPSKTITPYVTLAATH